MTMADRVAVLKDGVLQQCAPPRELFMRPINLFVAGFIGSPAMNLLSATVSDSGAQVGSLTVPLTAGQRSATTSSAVVVGVRPEGFTVADSGGLDCTVDLVEELGSESYLYCTASDAAHDQIVVRTEGLSSTRRGAAVSLVPSPTTLHLFDAATGSRLPSA
jgi:multiple sugar transport system ATP-binding protein